MLASNKSVRLALITALSALAWLANAQTTAPATPVAPAQTGPSLSNGPQAAPPTIASDPFKSPPVTPATVTQKPMRTYQQMLNDLDKQVPAVKPPKQEATPSFPRRKRVYDAQLGRYVTIDPKTRSRRYPTLAPSQPTPGAVSRPIPDPTSGTRKEPAPLSEESSALATPSPERLP